MSPRAQWAVAGAVVVVAAALWLSALTPTPPPLPQWRFGDGIALRSRPPGLRWQPFPLEAFERHGAAFGDGWAAGALPGQQPVTGARERLLNSFHGGDVSTGWLLAGPWPEARLVVGRVGGGADNRRLFVGVLSATDVVTSRSSGANSEHCQPFEELVPPGARLVIADFANGGWGHLLVSDLMWAEVE